MRKTAELRKVEIVATVLGLADRIGPDRVTTGAVAAAIGITQAALFRHFPTKAALWQAVAEDVSDRLSSAWTAALSSSADPVARLKALMAAQFDQISVTPAMPMLLFSRELNVENAALRAAFRSRLAAFQALLMHEIQEAQRSARLSNQVEASDAAVLMTSLVQGVAIRWALGARDFALREEGLRLFEVQLGLLAARES